MTGYCFTFKQWSLLLTMGMEFVCMCILRAGVQPTLDPYAEAFIAGPLR